MNHDFNEDQAFNKDPILIRSYSFTFGKVYFSLGKVTFPWEKSISLGKVSFLWEKFTFPWEKKLFPGKSSLFLGKSFFSLGKVYSSNFLPFQLVIPDFRLVLWFEFSQGMVVQYVCHSFPEYW